ncbi:hypothetical protein B0H13DRAFT_1602186 [Mycena leptocephala]|nr:hypothetical protein B0H13DRAFT_1602186 [Mycena leptocephala]
MSTYPSVGSEPDGFEPPLPEIQFWLRSKRLHKYTTCFAGVSWEELKFTDSGFERMGVYTVGAR